MHEKVAKLGPLQKNNTSNPQLRTATFQCGQGWSRRVQTARAKAARETWSERHKKYWRSYKLHHCYFFKKNTNLRWHDGSDFVFDSAFMNRIGFDDGAVSSTVFFLWIEVIFLNTYSGCSITEHQGRGLNDRSFHGKIKTSKGCIY